MSLTRVKVPGHREMCLVLDADAFIVWHILA